MRKILLIALTLLAAAPALASNRNCTSALVSGGICRDVNNWLIFYDAPPSHLADLRDAKLAQYNYQGEIICATMPQFQELLNGQKSKILNAAGASVHGCTVGQVTTNPQSETDFADAAIDYELRNAVIAYKHALALEQQEITEIPTPDTGAP